ncbi:signal peptide peptidase SppA [Capnocytophaga sp. ARDL2]|uniref:signal peptide peptidase SppA n=1 Tax=Capnocytophaga sp. ARDL2 TaxID=3238809 RepID=UPI003558FC56
MNFFKNVLSTIVGLILFTFIGFFLIILFFGIASMSSSSGSTKPVANNSVLKLDLSNIDKDYGGSVYIEDFDYKEKNKYDFYNVLNAIDYAKDDSKIKGISIENNSTSIGIAQRQALREKLEEFKKTGKFVLAYANHYSQAEYYLNSVADTIFINPMGGVDFKGLSTELLYMKNLQNYTGIEMQVIRHGKYKSAVEPFLQQEMSPENKLQNTELLYSIWNELVADISSSRKISIETLNEIADNQNARTAQLALEHKMVDKIAYLDEYKSSLKNALNISDSKDLKEIDIEDYVYNVKNNSSKENNQIAVIFAQGDIRGGEGSSDYIGEISINRSLEKARKNDEIKAVVLRIDSPGGSALTSELIWREIELTKKVKPVIVSMGNTAASGGYYIACNADYIFAEPTTITGSIGVYGMIPNAEKLGDKIGITSHQIGTHINSVGMSLFTPLSENEKKYLTENIEFIYDTFLERVAKGRNMTTEEVHEVAQGRVWTGTMALQHKLVDKLGSLDEAIQFAANKVGVENYKVTTHPTYKIKFADFLNSYFRLSTQNSIKESLINEIGLENYKMLEQINYIKKTDQIQAILPYKFEI